MIRRIVCPAVLALLSALAGCSGLKPYPNDEPVKNVDIRTAASSGSLFSSVRVELDVHAIDAGCNLKYLGTLPLDQTHVAVGVPTARASMLTFHFLSASVLGGARGRISREVTISPRPGQRYEVEVSYRDDLYDVTLRERTAGGTLRDLTVRDAKACSQSRSAATDRAQCLAAAGAQREVPPS